MGSETNFVVALIGLFAVTFICAALLRANGVRGLLALIGLIAAGFHALSDYEGWQLAAATIAALVGLAMGGKLSDVIEYRRKMAASNAEKDKRRREKGLA